MNEEILKTCVDNTNYTIYTAFCKAQRIMMRSYSPVCSISGGSDSDIMLGTAAPSSHTYADDEMIGGPVDDGESDASVINEDLGSLHDLLNHVDAGEVADEEE